jgi:formylglycine-generating enzyme required for sulfatase activity
MNDIFISYSSKDREWVARLAKALEAQGYEVWWDPEILPGQHYQDVIQKALHGAKSVVAVWTADSVQSDYVKAECLWAFTKRNLISVLGKDAEIPTPFNAIQAADLRKWKGSADDPQFQRLLRGIRFAQTGEIPPQPKVERPAPKSRLGVVLAGVAAVAVAGAGVYWQQNGGFAGENPPAIAEPAKPKPAPAPVEFKPAVTPPVAKPEVPKSYQLTVKTTPENAKISLSGGLGYSPGMLLQPGDYVVKVEADGYQPQEKAFTIAMGDETLTVELKPDHSAYEPEMVALDGGTFTMGCDPKRDDVEGGCADDEKPAHKVEIKPFKVAKTEVTVAQFRAFVEATGYKTTAEEKGSCRGDKTGKGEWEYVDGNFWKKPGFEQTDSDPVVCVSWEDTQKYLEWLNQKVQPTKPYRLPTEAEWEFAARGGKDGAYPWGQKGADGCSHANMADQAARKKYPDWIWATTCNDGYIYTAPVRKFQPNDYGLYDMHGNVWEWVQDWYASDYYKSSPASAPEGSKEGTLRVIRGGSWSGEPGSARSASRLRYTPDDRDDYVGFRLAQGQ